MADNCEYLYHRKKGFPDYIIGQLEPELELELEHTDHSKAKAKDNKYLNYNDRRDPNVRVKVPENVVVEPKQVFEAGATKRGKLCKIGFRHTEFTVINTPNTYDDYELCPIVDPRTGNVITIYLNHKDDDHDTLDTSNYHHPVNTPISPQE